jgi:thiol-disulfide isomerase/thioredoxin
MEGFMKKPLYAIAFAVVIYFAAAPETLTAQNAAVSPELAAAFARAEIQTLKQKVPIEDFSLPLVSGKTQSLAALAGKVVFLNFWATWCPPCREEMPSMEKLYQRFKSEGLEFFAVDIQEGKKEVEAFIKERGFTFPVALDAEGSAAATYGIRSIPTTFIIDKSGNIIAAAIGGRKWDSAEMIAAFGLLLRDGS